MPVLKISMIKGRTPAQKQALIQVAAAAMTEAFELPDSSYSVRLCEFSQADFYLPPPKTAAYLLIEADCFPGRSGAQKNAFYKKALSALAKMGEDPEQVLILLREPSMENWGYAGKKD